MVLEENMIVVENISKRYRMWNSPAARFMAPLRSRFSGACSYFPYFKEKFQSSYDASFIDHTALNRISLTVKKGDSVGVIGRNGSGKSTLLQIIAGVLKPTRGKVEVHGRIAALLELGAGFNPEFTGSENVMLNAAIMGVSDTEIRNRFDEIAAFADIGDYIGQPVKTYSSGMMVRLAFAVQTVLDPDLLIVDEALSVGDVFFQQKCFRRIRELIEKGTTVLFVSHDMTSVRSLCNRAVLLQKGEKIFEGLPEDAASIYYGGEKFVTKELVGSGSKQSTIDAVIGHNIVEMGRNRQGARCVKIVAASYELNGGINGVEVPVMEFLVLKVLVKAEQNVEFPVLGIHLYDKLNNLVFATNSTMCGAPLCSMKKDEERLFRLKVGLHVQCGLYSFTLGCSDGGTATVLDRIEGLGPIHVYQKNTDEALAFHGMVYLPTFVEEII